MFKILTGIPRWIGAWIYYICLICFAGSMVGLLSHLLFALLVVEQPDHGYYASLGLLHGLKYGGVWAGGLSIVICVMRARKEYLAKQPESPAL